MNQYFYLRYEKELTELIYLFGLILRVGGEIVEGLVVNIIGKIVILCRKQGSSSKHGNIDFLGNINPIEKLILSRMSYLIKR